MSMAFTVPRDRVVLEEVAACLQRIAQRLPLVERLCPHEFVTGTLEELTPINSPGLHCQEFVGRVTPVTTAEPAAATVFAPAPPITFAPVIPAPPAPVAPVIPTPPPAVIVPAPPVPAAVAPPAPGVPLDSESLPWDKRIHAGSKSFRQSDNTWKLLKGVDKLLVEQVKAELRAAMGAVPVAPAPPLAPAAVIPAPPLAPAAVIPAPPTPCMTFPTFVAAVSKHQMDGTITVIEVQDICRAAGFAALPLVASRPDMIPTLYAQMEAVWATRQPQ